MSDLFELNRVNLLKIFESHQIRGLILFTDILKICTALRIFPNLLSSKDLRKLIVQVCNMPMGEELSAKLSYKDLEDFLRCVSEKSFPRRRGLKEQYKMFFVHIRNPCFLRYALPIEIGEERSPSKGNLGSLFESSEKSLLSSSPYRKKLMEKKILSVNEALCGMKNNLALTNATSESSLSFSPASRLQPCLTSKSKSSFWQSSLLSLNSVLSQFDQQLVEFASKNSGIFQKNSYLRPMKSIQSAREKNITRQTKLNLAFKIWALGKNT